MFIQPQRGLERALQRPTLRKPGATGRSSAVGDAQFVNPAMTEVARSLEALLDGMPDVRDEVVAEGRKFLQEMPEYPDMNDIARLSATVSKYLTGDSATPLISTEDPPQND